MVFASCDDSKKLSQIKGKRIEINDTIPVNAEVEKFIVPYRERVNKDMDKVISYSPDTYSKNDGELNTAIGNLMADAVFEQSNPIFQKRTGNQIDLVLLNHGGIRSIISKGNITTKTAYQVMPFENYVVVVALKGRQVVEMVKFLSKKKKAHPIFGLQITLNDDYSLSKFTVNNLPVNPKKTYYVATNDYLYKGGDNMSFFKPNDSLYQLNYKIRNVLLDYFSERDTIAPSIDNRFIRLKS